MSRVRTEFTGPQPHPPKNPAARFLSGDQRAHRVNDWSYLCRHRNHFLNLQLDLFSWRQTPPRNASRAVLKLAKRFGLSIDVASTIAHLNGIGGSHYES